mmetsp:Transcript_71989/g.233952  ORF Transcript_71989/g.233952 Transcript_71989/m.233952 type:complete len:630 (+) Transcript_71989:2189-4078(+)
MHHHGGLHAADGVLRAPVVVALHQGVHGAARVHLRHATVDRELHGVPVVRQCRVHVAPLGQLEHGPRIHLGAHRHVDGALHLADPACLRCGALAHLRRPHAGLVGVPLRCQAALHVAIVQRLRGAVVAVGCGPTHGFLHLVELQLRQRPRLHERVPVHSLSAWRRGERAAVGPILAGVYIAVHQVEVDRADKTRRHDAFCEPASRLLRQGIPDEAQERVGVAQLVEEAQHTVPTGLSILRVNTMRCQRHLHTSDGVLRAPVPVALCERVDRTADSHLAGTGGLRGDLDRVPVVRQIDLMAAPSQVDPGPVAVLLCALGQIDRALHVACGADCVRLGGACGPLVGVPRVPIVVLAAFDIAPVQVLRRPVVSACVRPSNGGLELRKLGARHGCFLHERVPIDDLVARRGGQRPVVRPILGQVQARHQRVEVQSGRRCEPPVAAGVRRQRVLDRLQEGIFRRASVKEDAQHAIPARAIAPHVDAMRHERCLLAPDGVLRAVVEVALRQRVVVGGGGHCGSGRRRVDGELHRVTVVRERRFLETPGNRDGRPGLRGLALREVDGALHLARPAGLRSGALAHLRRPNAGLVRVVVRLGAALHLAPKQWLWRTVVATCFNPIHGRAHLVQLSLRH